MYQKLLLHLWFEIFRYIKPIQASVKINQRIHYVVQYAAYLKHLHGFYTLMSSIPHLFNSPRLSIIDYIQTRKIFRYRGHFE